MYLIAEEVPNFRPPITGYLSVVVLDNIVRKSDFVASGGLKNLH